MTGHSEKGHASTKLYWIFCIILCAITFVEWIVFKERVNWGLEGVMVPLLLVLSLVKFAMVCGWYMHLRYDHSILTKIFTVALAMGAATGVVLVILMA